MTVKIHWNKSNIRDKDVISSYKIRLEQKGYIDLHQLKNLNIARA